MATVRLLRFSGAMRAAAGTGVGVLAACLVMLPAEQAPASTAHTGAPLWVARYNGPANGKDAGTVVVASPDRSVVYVTGRSQGPGTGEDYATVAYNAATGAQEWVSRYAGHGIGRDTPRAAAVSPDGSAVYVTGASQGAGTAEDYATVAYNAVTGAQEWVSRYTSPGIEDDEATAIGVSPGGATVYVTGYAGGGYHNDFTTVAYNAVAGAQEWVASYNGPANLYDIARALTVAPNGSAVYVTGYSAGPDEGSSYATVAYDASTGAQLWVRRYQARRPFDSAAQAIAVSPDGHTIFVTGSAGELNAGDDYVTLAYAAQSGARLWATTYSGQPAGGDDNPVAIAVDPGGQRVYVTGTSQGRGTGSDYATLGYSAATGRQLWANRYNGPANGPDTAMSMAVSPGGSSVYVTGSSAGRTSKLDYATVAYRSATGAAEWIRRYNDRGNGDDTARSVCVGQDGRMVFVTGGSRGAHSGPDFATVAYRV